MADIGELFERGGPGFVRHEILAVAHRFDAERRALVRDRGADDELNGAVFENFLFAAGELGLRKLFRESRHQVRLLNVKRNQFASASDHGSRLPVNIPVIQPDD
jgi:hypothetical protein